MNAKFGMMLAAVVVGLAAGAACAGGPQTVALARCGRPLAEIVLADKPDRAARFAALELKWHLDRIAGGDFAIVSEGKATGLKPIYVGPCGATRAKRDDFALQQYVVDVRPDAIELVGRDAEDKGTVTYFNDERGVGGAGWPDMFAEQGSLYAVYAFLEDTVGVRWLDSTDYGTILPEAKNLTVPTGTRRAVPFVRYRAHSGNPTRYEPLLWKKGTDGYKAYEALAYAHPKTRDRQGELFQIRHRMGGDCAPANHSFYYFYAKYWDNAAKKCKNGGERFFAKGYDAGTQPPQLCYTSTDTVAQVIRDIREYFDSPKGPWRWGRNNYCLEPMDNASFCKCPTCAAEYEPSRAADKSSQSTHWFRFVNKVAKAIRASHPGKRIATLAYFQHEGLPRDVRLEDNVVVYFCLSGNRTPAAPLIDAQLARMREWRAAYPGQPLAMWLYNCFPLEGANNGNFHCFPGFFGHEAKRQYDIFRELDARAGIFQCGFDTEVENYLQLELMMDPSKDVERLLGDYFSMYGRAGKPLREFYDLVERRFCDRSLMPKGGCHQTAPIAWGILGTKDVMDSLAALMRAAEAAAGTDLEKTRVELWKRGIWNYMREGYESFTARMAAPQPAWTAKAVPAAGGDPAKVDWSKASDAPLKYFGAGSDEPSGYTGRIRLGHDGSWLYLELTLNVPDTTTLVNLPAICSHDCWEILMSRQKGRPYRCWFVAPDGRARGSSFGEVNWRNDVPAAESGDPAFGARSVSDLSNGRDWIARLAFPLDGFLDGPVAPGDSFYLNAVNCMGPEHPEVAAWRKTHGGRFIMSTLTSHTTVHTTDRIGTVTLEPLPAARVPAKTVWMNEDNGHFYDHPDEDMTAEGCRRLVDVYARSGTITGILFCVNVQRALYDSDVWERVRDISPDISYSKRLKLLSDRGVDHFGEWLRRCREVGIAGWLTMRMNDCHGCEELNWDLPCHGTFKMWPSQMWRQHPEWRRAPYRHERSWESAYNYLVPEVYAHHLALAKEVLSKWDMVGLELDWLRWGMCFPPGGEYEGRRVLTRFVREVRALADAAERRVGHRILLGHRVPVAPDVALQYGFDVAAWAEAGCVDMLTLSGFMAQAPDDLPVETWRRLLKPGTVVNASCSPGRSSCPYNQVSDDVILRGNAASAWACGVDGLYLFNQCYREPAHVPELEDYLLDICSQANVQRATRRTAVGSPEPMPGYAQRMLFPYPLAPRFIGCSMARMDRNVTIRITTGPVLPESKCTLTLCFDAEAGADRLKDLPVRVNTVPCSFARRIDLDLGRIDQSKPYVRSGAWPRDAKTVLEYDVPPSALHSRENAIELLPPEGAKGNVIWADIGIRIPARS